MEVCKIEINSFLEQAKTLVVVDVRSPIEFNKGHLPGAINIPLFEDAERSEIGTIYKHQGKDDAVIRGLELVSPKLATFVKSVKEISKTSEVLVYCFRGGMRSSSFAWLLNTSGLKTSILEGGYKKFRNEMISQVEKPLPLIIIGGSTGSGKTEIIHELAKSSNQIVDLEGIAHHKGSAFGAINEPPQPTQQQFENLLSIDIKKLCVAQHIFMEDESFSIGRVKLPYPLWLQMKKAPIIKIVVPFEIRVQRLVEDYGNTDIETLRKPLLAIQRRLGGQHVKAAIEFLEKGELDKVAEIALNYYDEAYQFNHDKRELKNIYEVHTTTGDGKINAALIMDFLNSEKQIISSLHPNKI